jgi:hypothetical protein
LLEANEAVEAGARLEATLTELEGFGFPQWHALAAVLLGDAHRRGGRFDESAAWIARGIKVASAANYRYAVAIGERVAGRLARDTGDEDLAKAALDRAITVFTSIGASFEAERTRGEMTADRV